MAGWAPGKGATKSWIGQRDVMVRGKRRIIGRLANSLPFFHVPGREHVFAFCAVAKG
jgi:hypothetical protein